MRTRITLLLLFFAAGAASAQNKLTLEDIFTKKLYENEKFGPARWLDGGAGYTTVEASDSGGHDIVRYATESGRREVLVPASELTPAGRSAPLAIDDYKWSRDGTKMLIYTNIPTQRRSGARRLAVITGYSISRRRPFKRSEETPKRRPSCLPSFLPTACASATFISMTCM